MKLLSYDVSVLEVVKSHGFVSAERIASELLSSDASVSASLHKLKDAMEVKLERHGKSKALWARKVDHNV